MPSMIRSSILFNCFKVLFIVPLSYEVVKISINSLKSIESSFDVLFTSFYALRYCQMGWDIEFPSQSPTMNSKILKYNIN